MNLFREQQKMKNPLLLNQNDNIWSFCRSFLWGKQEKVSLERAIIESIFVIENLDKLKVES